MLASFLLSNFFLAPAADPPDGLTAVQVDATTVLVSWTAPSSGLTPSGYRIYYHAEGDQMFTTADTGQNDTEYSLIDLLPCTTYSIAMVTLSEQLPSSVTDTVSITLGVFPVACMYYNVVKVHYRGCSFVDNFQQLQSQNHQMQPSWKEE